MVARVGIFRKPVVNQPRVRLATGRPHEFQDRTALPVMRTTRGDSHIKTAGSLSNLLGVKKKWS